MKHTFNHDTKQALARVMDLMAIAGSSGGETAVADYLKDQLAAAGLPVGAMRHDQAHRKSPLKGDVGNLIVKLPASKGRRHDPRRVLSAHMDTVPLAVASRPIRKGGWVHSKDAHTALGADDRAGVAATLTAALEILQRDLPHGPLTFFWPVQEEVGLHGSRHMTASLLGTSQSPPKMAFNFDGGSPAKLTIGATGAYRLAITLHGIASHAGVAPEYGVSAITIAGKAIARLEQDGWLGKVEKGRHSGTSNIGVIQGGDATNVITDHVLLGAEVRSHHKAFRKRMLDAFRKAFEDAAAATTNIAQQQGRVEIEVRHDYEAYRLKKNDPCVALAKRAIQAIGGQAVYAITDGGLDANWMNLHGIPTVSLGCGQQDAHKVTESLNIHSYHLACDLALRLACD